MSLTEGLGLVDDHCHGLVTAELDPDGFRALATESDWLSSPGLETLDSPFGVAIRSRCAPLLDLPAHAGVEQYLQRREELGSAEVIERLMSRAGVAHFVIETGFLQSPVASPQQMQDLLGLPASTVVRLERIAEELWGSTSAGSFAADFAAALDRESVDAVGYKTIAAYRFGLDLPDAPPQSAALVAAVGEWLSSGDSRVTDPTIISHLVWESVGRGLPLQIHVGFGDSDLVLHRADPSRLTGFLAATRESGTPIVLLHCYPFVREAGSLAHIFPHVHFDVGEVSHYLGPSARVAIRQAFELAPFHKLMFSSDAYGLPEHYYLSASIWRSEVDRLFDEWIADDWISVPDAERVVAQVASGTARRVYGLEF